MKKTVIVLSAVILLMGQGVSAQQKFSAPDCKFTTVKENPVTSVKNQYRSGTCWCFSGISFIESETLRTTGKTVDLSEMFVVGNSYYDRSIKYVRLDGNLKYGAGSAFGDVFDVVKNYGIVPQEVYSGMNYGTEMPEQAELDAVLLGYMDAVVSNPNKKLTTAWKNGLKGILNAYLGEIPQEFSVDGVNYTPASYRDALGINTDDYINITSFTHHPFYEPFVIEVCDNWRWSSAYNVPVDEMMQIIDSAIENGYTIAWGTDVSEYGFTRDGIAIVASEKPKAGSDQEHWTGKAEEKKADKSVFPEEPEITQEMRQVAFDNKTTTDDHGMQIFGIAKDKDGKKFYMVKNSWGATGRFDGIWYASEAFVKYKTLNFIVHKDAIPKNIKKELGIK